MPFDKPLNVWICVKKLIPHSRNTHTPTFEIHFRDVACIVTSLSHSHPMGSVHSIQFNSIQKTQRETRRTGPSEGKSPGARSTPSTRWRGTHRGPLNSYRVRHERLTGQDATRRGLRLAFTEGAPVPRRASVWMWGRCGFAQLPLRIWRGSVAPLAFPLGLRQPSASASHPAWSAALVVSAGEVAPVPPFEEGLASQRAQAA
jgi:hypothetical protein